MKVKFHNPEFPNDMEFDFGGISVINGKTVTLTDDQLLDYKAHHGVALKERLLANEFATVDGTQGKVKYLHPSEDDVIPEPIEAEHDDKDDK